MKSFTLGLIALTALFVYVEGTKVVRCKSTFRSGMDPACSMRTEFPNNEMMCTSADVFAELGGYFSLEDTNVPICVTYIFQSNASLGGDDAPPGIWLFRGPNFDPRFKTCENVCSFIRTSTAGSSYKNLYVGCFTDEDGNDEDVNTFWMNPTQYDCSADDKFYNKKKPSPITTPAPTTTTSTTTTSTTTTSTTTTPTTTTATTPTPISPDGGSSATLIIGIVEAVVGVLGTAFIATAAVVLFLTLKKVNSNQ